MISANGGALHFTPQRTPQHSRNTAATKQQERRKRGEEDGDGGEVGGEVGGSGSSWRARQLEPQPRKYDKQFPVLNAFVSVCTVQGTAADAALSPQT
jgi:hypothetical protein